MERLDQGHLYPKLKVSASNQTRASAVGGEHSRKELFDERVKRDNVTRFSTSG